MSIIKTKKESMGRINVFHSNGVHIGVFLVGDDGYWAFWPVKERVGFLSQELLQSLVKELENLNEGWDNQVNNYFNNLMVEMKTVEEKAKQWINENIDVYDDDTIKSLVTILKEQDRDTRHACAEAVMNIRYHPNTESMISKSDAHDACINVKAV